LRITAFGSELKVVALGNELKDANPKGQYYFLLNNQIMVIQLKKIYYLVTWGVLPSQATCRRETGQKYKKYVLVK